MDIIHQAGVGFGDKEHFQIGYCYGETSHHTPHLNMLQVTLYVVHSCHGDMTSVGYSSAMYMKGMEQRPIGADNI